MMATQLENDKTARDKITNDIKKSYFVEAGAGSGKTFSLVERLVKMVENGIDVRKICAITFTKAAAGEFYARFAKRLNQRLTEDISADARKNIENALENIDLCFLNTIDSFTNMILSEHPAVAKIPSNSHIISSGELDTVYRREYSKIARGEYGEDLKNKYYRFIHTTSVPFTVFCNGLNDLTSTRNFKTVYEQPKTIDYDVKFSREKYLLNQLFNKIANDRNLIFIQRTDNPNKFRDIFDKYENDLFKLQLSWNKNLTSVSTILNAFKGFRLESNKEIEEYFNEIVEVKKDRKNNEYIQLTAPSTISTTIKNNNFSIGMDFLVNSFDAITQKRRKNGELVFSDYLNYLRDMLKEDMNTGCKLINHIHEKHSYFLIDEFQDTDPVQAEIFFYLSALEPKQNWKECIPRPGSLFIVGDPKQSIYRFRNADVSSYLTVKELFKKDDVGEVLQLSKNFRSTKKLCDWFNQTFSEILPEGTNNQSIFVEIPTEENRQPTEGLNGIYYYKTKTGKDALPGESDAERLSDIIRKLVNNPELKIQTKGDKEARRISYKDIMIITPKKPPIKALVTELGKYDIPVQVEGSTSFNNCPSLKMISKLYSAVAYPNDKTKVYAALTCGCFGISESDIISFVNGGKKLTVFPVTTKEEEENKINNALSELCKTVKKSKYSTPVAIFAEIEKQFGIFEHAKTTNLESYFYAKELLRTAESNNEVTSIREAANYVESLSKNETQLERCLNLSTEEDRVHIANLHKVKGLEAPIVILASPSIENIKVHHRTQECSDGNKCWFFGIKDNNNNTRYSTSLYEQEKELEKETLDAERKRFLYVAATRAKDVLIIADNESKHQTNPWKVLLKGLDGNIFDLIGEEETKFDEKKDTVSADELLVDGKKSAIVKDITTDSSYSIKRPSSIKIKAKTASEDDLEDVNIEEADEQAKLNAAFIGTIIHKLMEILVSSADTLNLENAINEICWDYMIDDPKYKEILISVADKMMNGGFEQQNKTHTDLLAEMKDAEKIFCELPFCRKTVEEGRTVIWNGIMDLVYCKNGKWYIVDYKTNAEADDLDEKYQEQLKAYVEALKEIEGVEAEARIYHIDK